MKYKNTIVKVAAHIFNNNENLGILNLPYEELKL